MDKTREKAKEIFTLDHFEIINADDNALTCHDRTCYYGHRCFDCLKPYEIEIKRIMGIIDRVFTS